MRRGGLCRDTLAGLVLTLALVGPLGAEPALTDEDVVRLFVSGNSTDDIVRLIEARDGNFDLDPEMLNELREAGLPERIIRAMQLRMAPRVEAVGQAAPAQSVERTPVATLRIRLNSDRKEDKPELLRIQEPVGFQLLASLELRDSPENASFTDLAVFLADTTAVHVPDQWRSHSSLGRDFISMPRHKLLAFVSGAERRGKQEGRGTLELEIPEEIEVSLEPGTPHDLMLGIAVRVGGRYYRFVHDALADIAVEDELVLEARVESGWSGGADTLNVRFKRGFVPSDEPDGD